MGPNPTLGPNMPIIIRDFYKGNLLPMVVSKNPHFYIYQY